MGAVTPLARRLVERMKAQAVPWEVTLELTKYCNFDCVHCYVPRGNLGVRRELVLEEIRGFLDDFHAMGGMFLHLTGGEIMVHRNFREVVRHARSLNMAVKMTSNGSRVTEEVADEITELGVGYVGVSLYGADPGEDERVTRKRGSHEAALKGIRLLASRGVQVRVKLPVMRADYAGIDRRVEIVKALGLPFSVDWTITPKNDGDRSTEAERISMDQILDLQERIRGPYRPFMNPGGTGDRSQWRDAMPPEGKSGVSGCNVGLTFCAVDSFGDVFPCIAFPAVAGNLREQRFEEIWRTSPLFLKLREASLEDVKGCNTCEVNKTCSRCIGHAYLVDGDMMGPSSMDCIKMGKEPPRYFGAGKC